MPKPPKQIVLDIDTTDFAIHGEQEGRFYHGYYDHYCYLPLYVFAGEHVLCARLRPSNLDPSAGSRKEIERIVKRIRAAWPQVKIILRGDSGFCREELMAWCEANRVDYVFGMARNPLLEKIVADALEQARQQWEQTQQTARVFIEFEHETASGTWSRRRRVVAKAEHIDGKSNPPFVVTSLAETSAAQQLYEDLYCARGDMENRIKVARKLAILLHKLWVSGEVYDPLRNSNRGDCASRWLTSDLQTARRLSSFKRREGLQRSTLFRGHELIGDTLVVNFSTESAGPKAVHKRRQR